MSSIIQFNARDRGNVLGIVEDQIWVHFSNFSTFVIFPDSAQARVEVEVMVGAEVKVEKGRGGRKEV